MSEAETHELMRTLPMLSIRRPWAWLIIRPDLMSAQERIDALLTGKMKPVENRDWPDWYPARGFRGRFLIHASSGMTRKEYVEACGFAVDRGIDLRELPTFNTVQRGGVVGVATVTRGITKHVNPGSGNEPDPCGSDNGWFTGPYGLVLDDVEPVAFVPCKGALGFFRWRDAA